MKYHQNGASLVIILLFVGLVLGAISLYYKSQDKVIRSNAAEVAAWEGIQIARAARLFVRNQIATNGGINPQQAIADVSKNGLPITINELIGAKLLPSNFLGNGTVNPRTDAGGNFLNALGQQITIIQQNFPLGGDPLDPETVPTAYVIFNEDPNVDNGDESNTMHDVASAMYRMDMMLYAPLYNGVGNNISNACRGDSSIAYWDTNCLNNADFRVLTAGTDFAQGSLVIPAWRSVSFDTRALMRFPQPEQGGLNTMLTDLSMGNLACGSNVTIGNPDMGVINAANAICETTDDDPLTGDDNRRSILRPGLITTDNLILDAQAGLDVYSYDTTVPVNQIKTLEDSDEMVIPGNLIITNGDARIFGDSLGVNGDAVIASNVILPDNTVTQFATIESDMINTDGLTLSNSPVTTSAKINTYEMNVDGDVEIENYFSSNVLNINPRGLPYNLSTDDLSVGTFTTPIDQLSVKGTNTLGSSGYSVISRTVTVADITVTDGFSGSGVTVEQTLNNGTGTIEVTNDRNSALCTGDCPTRTGAAICNALNVQGKLSESGFSSLQDCLDKYN